MKNKVFALLMLMSAWLMQSCVTSSPGYYATVYINYEVIQAAGCEVYESDVPDGHKAIGHLYEIVKFPRSEVTKSAGAAKRMVIGNKESDTQMLVEHLAKTIKDRGAIGVANLKVTATMTENPTFTISGTLYK